VLFLWETFSPAVLVNWTINSVLVVGNVRWYIRKKNAKFWDRWIIILIKLTLLWRRHDKAAVLACMPVVS